MSTAMAVEAKIINGVNVSALFETIAAVKSEAAIANFNFRATNKWMAGDRNRTTIGQFSGALQEHRTDGKTFVFENGEHPVLLGADGAPNPVEWLLHALIGCMTTTTVYHAAARNIAIEAIDSQLEGDLDLRGFLGISPEVRNGYNAIRVRMRVKTKAHPAAIKALTQMSPVYDTVSRSVPVTVDIETY